MKKEPPLQPQCFPTYFGFFKITSMFDASFDLSYLHSGTKIDLGASWGVLGLRRESVRVHLAFQ